MKYFSLMIGALILTLIATNGVIWKKYQEVKLENAQLQDKLTIQNQAIRELEIDTYSYTCNLGEIEQILKGKYAEVIHIHEEEACEVRLRELEKALDIYNN